MMKRSSRCGWVVALAMLVAGGAAHAQQQKAGGGRPGTIQVEMTGFRSDKGTVLVALYTSAQGFPDQPGKAVARREVKIRGGKSRVLIRGLAPRVYAVSILHDEDGDKKMKSGALGMPREGYGASNDARGKFGPPRFDDAKVTLRPGQTLRTPIKLIYH
jgi:uncharacterized protein (DUF2141 family)